MAEEKVALKQLRAGAYSMGDYLIRYTPWINVEWDGPRETYRGWHIFRRASAIDNRILIERRASLVSAQAFVSEQLEFERKRSS